jgi:hypothetical protein
MVPFPFFFSPVNGTKEWWMVGTIEEQPMTISAMDAQHDPGERAEKAPCSIGDAPVRSSKRNSRCIIVPYEHRVGDRAGHEATCIASNRITPCSIHFQPLWRLAILALPAHLVIDAQGGSSVLRQIVPPTNESRNNHDHLIFPRSPRQPPQWDGWRSHSVFPVPA